MRVIFPVGTGYGVGVNVRVGVWVNVRVDVAEGVKVRVRVDDGANVGVDLSVGSIGAVKLGRGVFVMTGAGVAVELGSIAVIAGAKLCARGAHPATAKAKTSANGIQNFLIAFSEHISRSRRLDANRRHVLWRLRQ
jgi:hypothetical protein